MKTIQSKQSEIEKLESELQRKKEELLLLEHKQEVDEKVKQGLYVPLKTARIIKNMWYISENQFNEISNGWYTASEFLGSPTFKRNDPIVLLKIDDNDYRWYPFNGLTHDYYGIEDNEYGISSDYENIESYITDIKDI